MLTRTLSLRAGALLAGLALAACGTTTTPVEDTGLGPDTGPPPGTDAGPDDSGPGDAGPDVDSGPAPVCDPGAMQVGDCGFCGSQAQECDAAGQWVGTTACIGEGECAFGTAETRDLAMCAQDVRLCLDGCVWGDWAEVRPAGACEVGETRTSADACGLGELRDEECSPTCDWAATSMCADPCGGSARTTPEWKREVCVPAGNFVRGSLTYTISQPVADVYVSSYYVDVYPVTNRRYAECVTAGACRRGGHSTYGWYIDGDLTYEDYPAQYIYYPDAVAFCAWDGGRRLPTEAEWEKAARGPSPRENAYPWPPGTTWDCTIVDDYECGYRGIGAGRDYWGYPYDLFPRNVSYYGVRMQMAGVMEWVADHFSRTFYADPASRTDPLATAADTEPDLADYRVIRGFARGERPRQELALRRGAGALIGASLSSRQPGFRCARPAP